MNQPSLPFQRHSDTSIEAAMSKIMDAATELGRVYRHLLRAGHQGATDEEMQTALEMNPSTQRPRRIDLVNQGLVMDSSRRRATTSGRQAVVWIRAR